MSYIWTDSSQTVLKYVDEENNEVTFFPADPRNSDYAEFLASGKTAAPYVEPPVPQDLRTNEEKLEQATGLTVAEIKAVLGL